MSLKVLLKYVIIIVRYGYYTLSDKFYWFCNLWSTLTVYGIMTILNLYPYQDLYNHINGISHHIDITLYNTSNGFNFV